VGVKNRGKV